MSIDNQQNTLDDDDDDDSEVLNIDISFLSHFFFSFNRYEWLIFDIYSHLDVKSTIEETIIRNCTMLESLALIL